MAAQSFSPTTLEDAIALLADSKLDATAIAGCTDLMVVDHATHNSRPAVVDLLRLSELKGIVETNDHIDIGAAETFWAIRQNPLVKQHLPTLAEVAATVGAWQIQNRATIGGNIANASPAGDSLPVLLSLGAQLKLQGPDGIRVVDYADMHLGYRQTLLKKGELIVRILVPKAKKGSLSFFKKVGTREAQAISKVVIACTFELDGERVMAARMAAGSVAATPIRFTGAEQILRGQPLTPERINEAVKAVRQQVQPITDVRSTADYRHFVLGQVILRMLKSAAQPNSAQT